MSMANRISVKHKVTDRVLVNYYTQRYELNVDNGKLEEYKAWCKEKVGTNGWNYFGQYRNIPFEFRFKRAEDLLAFKLTFGL